MFYITQSGQIYSGDPQNNDRALTEEEANLVRNGRFTVVNNQVVDVTLQPGYSQNQRINEINSGIEEIHKQLDAWDLKSIRALREGGTLEDGTTYLDFYQLKINTLREELTELNAEKVSLENELAELLETAEETNDIT